MLALGRRHTDTIDARERSLTTSSNVSSGDSNSLSAEFSECNV